jgi:hypothetical protein
MGVVQKCGALKEHILESEWPLCVVKEFFMHNISWPVIQEVIGGIGIGDGLACDHVVEQLSAKEQD